MNPASYFLGLLVAVLITALGELVSDEIQARLDRIPLSLLAAAARRLPRELRGKLYGQAWLPELRHILQGDRAMPITRLTHGMRYALRLWLSAPQIRRELIPEQASTTLSKRILQCAFSPSYVVAINSLFLPLTAVSISYSVRQSSWIGELLLAAIGAANGLQAIFTRRRLIRRHGFVPNREMFCRCIYSATIRALVIPITVAITSIVTIQAFQVSTASSLPITSALLIIGFIGIHLALMRLGFGHRDTTSV